MSHRLAAFDLDGTLLNSDHALSSRSERMLRHLYEQGTHIVLATARSITVVRRLLRGLSIFKGPNALKLSPHNPTRWLLAPGNGASVYDENYECIASEVIDPRICKALYQVLLSDPDVNTHVFLTVTPEDRAAPGYVNLSDREGDLALDEWVCRYPDEKEAAVQRRGGLIQKVMPNLEVQLRTTGVKSICYMCHKREKQSWVVDQVRAAVDKVEKEYSIPNSVRVSPSALHCIDVVISRMGKADAVQLIADKLGIPLSQCVAFGDGMNDAEMLRVVGKGYVMGNANPALKAALPDNEVIGSNDDDAVAATVEKLFDLP